MDFASLLESSLGSVNEIEIVPGYLLPSDGFCVVDGVLGIDRKLLAVEYGKVRGQYTSPELSLIAVLATTENYYALNYRKRLCMSGQINPAEELQLTTVILGSHLYKHCKSSFVWFHRRWLLTTFALHVSLEDEWSVVSRAAVHHPMNYFAFTYLRWATQLHQNSTDRLREPLRILCLQHLGDVSMWSFLHWLNDTKLHKFALQTNAEHPGHPAILGASQTNKNNKTCR